MPSLCTTHVMEAILRLLSCSSITGRGVSPALLTGNGEDSACSETSGEHSPSLPLYAPLSYSSLERHPSSSRQSYPNTLCLYILCVGQACAYTDVRVRRHVYVQRHVCLYFRAQTTTVPLSRMCGYLRVQWGLARERGIPWGVYPLETGRKIPPEVVEI